MTEHVLGFFSSWVICALVLGLQVLLPARQVRGYARDEISNEPLSYRLNGLRVLLVVVATWLLAGYADLLPLDWFWRHRWSALGGACVLGIVGSMVAIRGVPAMSNSWLGDFYLGRRANPRMINGRVDAKMYLYVAGAAIFVLNILSFATHHFLNNLTDPSLGVVVYACLFCWFICDYMVFEHVHLYTYDLFAERLGFKLIWGCLAFYPYFYVIGLWAIADLPNPGSPTWLLILSVIVFLAGWILARGANMQKYFFKRDPDQPFLGLIENRRISDGERHLLCSGYWGISRHVNYLGEGLMAVGLTLSLGWPSMFIPWLYPLYYAVFLTTRERDDDRRCEQKYGELWRKYRQEVPWRIIPYLY